MASGNTKRFLEESKSLLKDHGVKLCLRKSHYVHDGNRSKLRLGGFYDGTKLVVARNHPDWLEVYVHEYSHFIQDITGEKSYKKFINSKNPSFNTIRANEYNCEKISLNLIKKYNLPINIDRYSQKANSCICFYHVYERTNIWNSKKSIVSSKILQSMPKRLNKNFIHSIDGKRYSLLEGCL